MVAYQRQAWFNAIVTSGALMLFGALIPVLGPIRAQGAFALLALTAFDRLFFRKRANEVVSDERDRQINHRAIQVGVCVFWILLVEGAIMAYFLRSKQGTISIEVLPFIVWAGWAVFLLAHSVTMLILYRRS